jgi:dTDP-4-dehydrorhamnose 3,5-epimerase
VDGLYAPQAEGGLAWDDPDLGITWPVEGEPVLSDKDRVWPRLKDLGAVAF